MRKKLLFILAVVCSFVFISATISYAANQERLDVGEYTFVLDDSNLLSCVYEGDTKLTDVCMLLEVNIQGEDIIIGVLDPASTGSGDIWYFDGNGNASKLSNKSLSLQQFRFKEKDLTFLVKNGSIQRPEEEKNMLLDGHMYNVKTSGEIVAACSGSYVEYQGTLYYVTESDGSCTYFNGIHDGFYYKDGNLYLPADNEYLQIEGKFYCITPDGEAIVPEEGDRITYNGLLYVIVDADGEAELFTGVYDRYMYVDGVVDISGDEGYALIDGKMYYRNADGSLDLAGEGTYVMYEDLCYEVIDSDGMAEIFTGVYDDYYYLDGKVYETDSAQYILDGSIMYYKYKGGNVKISKNGRCALCNGVRYEVIDDIGTARLFNGIYGNYYYIDGLKYKTDENIHMIVNQCMYYKYASGYIKPTPEGCNVLCDGIRYLVGANGYPTKLSGVYNSYLYKNGKKVVTANGDYRFIDYVMYYKQPNGKVKYPKEDTYAKCNGILYYIENSRGDAYEFSGIYNSYLYEEGKLVKSSKGCYIIYNGQTYYKSTTGKMTMAKKGKHIVMGGRLYLVENEYGDAYAFTGVYKKKYYKNGNVSSKRSTYITYKSKLYYIKSDGNTAIYTGMYKSRYYKKGVKNSFCGVYKGKVIQKGKYYKPKKKIKMIINGYLHKVSTNGSYKKYKKKSGKKYTTRCKCVDGNYYIYKIYPKSGKAYKYKKNKKKSGTYKKMLKKKVYKVSYKTGKADLFTGVYKKIYYKNSARVYSKKVRYIIYNGYIYKVKKNGYSKIYKKNKKKKGTYVKKIGDNKYDIYYKTGKVKYGYDSNPSRQKLIQTAMKYLGISDKKNGHKCILDIYNSQSVLARGYRIKTWDPWCATFASAMAIKTKFTNIIKTEVSCYYQMLGFMSMGRWRENENYKPKTGDYIYYDWQDNGKGDNRGVPDHVGIVEKVSGGYITVIEGNKNGCVARRVIKVNGRYIRGYGLPAFKS